MCEKDDKRLWEMCESVVVIQLSVLKSNLWCSIDQILNILLKRHWVFLSDSWTGVVCLLVSHVASLKCLLINHMCHPSTLCIQVVTHFYLKNAFIQKGHNVFALTERVEGYVACKSTPVLFSNLQSGRCFDLRFNLVVRKGGRCRGNCQGCGFSVRLATQPE